MTDTQQFQQNDVVVRTALEYGNVEEGGVYVVDDVPDNWDLVLLDDTTWYDQRGFELADVCDGEDGSGGPCRRVEGHDGGHVNPDICYRGCQHDHPLIPHGRAASEQESETPRLDETLSEPTVFDDEDEGPFDSDHDVLFPLGSPVTVIEGGLVDGPGAGDMAPELFIGQRLVVHAEEGFAEDNPDHIVVLNGDVDPGRWAVARLSHVVPIAPAPEEEPDEEPETDTWAVDGDLHYEFDLGNDHGAPCSRGIAETVEASVKADIERLLDETADDHIYHDGWSAQREEWQRIRDTLRVEVL